MTTDPGLWGTECRARGRTGASGVCCVCREPLGFTLRVPCRAPQGVCGAVGLISPQREQGRRWRLHPAASSSWAVGSAAAPVPAWRLVTCRHTQVRGSGQVARPRPAGGALASVRDPVWTCSHGCTSTPRTHSAGEAGDGSGRGRSGAQRRTRHRWARGRRPGLGPWPVGCPWFAPPSPPPATPGVHTAAKAGGRSWDQACRSSWGPG